MDNYINKTELPFSESEKDLYQRQQQVGSYPTGSLPTGGLPIGGLPTGGLPIGGLPTGGLPTGIPISPNVIQSYAAQYGGRPPTPPPQQAAALVQQLKANPQLLQQVIQARPRSLEELFSIMGGGALRSSEESRGLCPPGWEIVVYIGPFGIPQVDLVFNILPFFFPGIVVGFVAPFFLLQVITGVVFEICL